MPHYLVLLPTSPIPVLYLSGLSSAYVNLSFGLNSGFGSVSISDSSYLQHLGQKSISKQQWNTICASFRPQLLAMLFLSSGVLSRQVRGRHRLPGITDGSQVSLLINIEI